MDKTFFNVLYDLKDRYPLMSTGVLDGDRISYYKTSSIHKLNITEHQNGWVTISFLSPSSEILEETYETLQKLSKHSAEDPNYPLKRIFIDDKTHQTGVVFEKKL